MKWHGLGVLPSARLAWWVALGALWWSASGLSSAFATVGLLYNVALLGVALGDWLLLTRARDVELERRAPERFNLGAVEEVALQVRNRGKWPLQLTVRDETPQEWRVLLFDVPRAESPDITLPTLAKLPVRVEAGREIAARYRVLPERRGDFSFGALSARWSSPLGLWHRQTRKEAAQVARVYPDASLVRRYELRLRQGRVAEMGLHLLRLRGRGTEFESLREYTRDDEFKNINWKASARRGKLIATNYEVERDQTILIALDCGRMMTAQARLKIDDLDSANRQSSIVNRQLPLSKLDCAINATVLLAHVAASMGDFVGLMLFADGVLNYVPPRKGKTQVGAMVDAIYGVQPRLVEPDYAAAYEHLLSRKLRRALVVTFTDLIDPFASRELVAASGALRRHHNALCVTLQDSDVLDLAAHMPQSPLEAFQKAEAQRMLGARESGLNELRKRGVSVLDVPAAQLSVETVNRYLDLKSRAAL